jgi:hypothetical protein
MGDGRECGVVKLCDFGLARCFRDPALPLSKQGTYID